MNAMTQQRFGLVDPTASLATYLAEIGPGDGLERAHSATASPSRWPVLSGASYVAALNGEPWRPRG